MAGTWKEIPEREDSRSKIMFIAKIVLIIVCVFVSGWLFLSFYQPFQLVRIFQRLIPGIIFYVPNAKYNFSLTFDDGPNPPYTDQVLNILKIYEAKATFFLIGEKIQKYPEYLDSIGKDGHQVANHFYTNSPTIFLTKEEIIDSLNKTETIINQPTSIRYFRPASGWIAFRAIELAKKHNYQAVLGSAYVSDPYHPPRWLMLKSLKCMLRPGTIVVLHDGGGNRQHSIDVLSSLLQYAKEMNLTSVTLHELINAASKVKTQRKNKK